LRNVTPTPTPPPTTQETITEAKNWAAAIDAAPTPITQNVITEIASRSGATVLGQIENAINMQETVIDTADAQLTVADNIIADADKYDFSSYEGGKTQYIKDVAALKVEVAAAKENLTQLTSLQIAQQTYLTNLQKTIGVNSITETTDYYVVTYTDEDGKEKKKRFDTKAEADKWAFDYDIHHRKYVVTYKSEKGEDVSVEFDDPDKALRFKEALEEPSIAQAYATNQLLSGHLWSISKNYTDADLEWFLGIPYSPKYVFETQAILAGSLENVISPILNLIPGRQPYEVLPTEMNVSWKNLEGRGMSPERLFSGQVAGVSAELLGTYLGTLGVGAVAGVGLGAAGGIITRIPKVGDVAFKAGALLSKIGAGKGVIATIGKAALVAPIAVFEGAKLYSLSSSGEPLWKVTAQGAIDLTGMVGFGQGVTKGIRVGQSIPNYLSRLYSGGVTVKAAQVTPEYVLSGEKSFPQFAEEPYPPTPAGYKQMALSYTPEELRVAGKIPSYHATEADIAASLGEEGAAAGRHGTGMFWSPATSPNFLRLQGETSLAPGLPNIFGRPTLLAGSFDDIVATGLSKTSPDFIRLGEKYINTGTLLMPVEQLGEAQSIIPAGTKFVSFGGKNWLDFGGGVLVEIKRVLPMVTATASGIEGAVIDVTRPSYSLSYRSGTPYLPTVASMAATGFTMTGKISSVSITLSQAKSLVSVIKTNSLNNSQISSALSVLTPQSLASVLKISSPSIRNTIVSSIGSSGQSSSVVKALNTLSQSESREIVSSLSTSTLKSIVSQTSSTVTPITSLSNASDISSVSDTSSVGGVSAASEISEVKPTPSISDVDATTTPIITSVKTTSPPPTGRGRLKLTSDTFEERRKDTVAGFFKVVFNNRLSKTLEASNFHDALSRAYGDHGKATPRVVEVIRLGETRRRA